MNCPHQINHLKQGLTFNHKGKRRLNPSKTRISCNLRYISYDYQWKYLL